jgi:hypothetical protein
MRQAATEACAGGRGQCERKGYGSVDYDDGSGWLCMGFEFYPGLALTRCCSGCLPQGRSRAVCSSEWGCLQCIFQFQNRNAFRVERCRRWESHGALGFGRLSRTNGGAAKPQPAPLQPPNHLPTFRRFWTSVNTVLKGVGGGAHAAKMLRCLGRALVSVR